MQENTTRIPKLKLLKQPLTEFFDRFSHPSNLSLTLNRLIFDSLLRKDAFPTSWKTSTPCSIS